MAEQAAFQAGETGYQQIQATKPQSLSYALNDSPAGLAGWILEKFRTWSDCGGDVFSAFTKNELLTTNRRFRVRPIERLRVGQLKGSGPGYSRRRGTAERVRV